MALLKSPGVHIVLLGSLVGMVLIVVLGRPSTVEDDGLVVVTASDLADL